MGILYEPVAVRHASVNSICLTGGHEPGQAIEEERLRSFEKAGSISVSSRNIRTEEILRFRNIRYDREVRSEGEESSRERRTEVFRHHKTKERRTCR